MRDGKRTGNSIISTHQSNSLEVGGPRNYCFPKQECEKQAPRLPLSLSLFVVAPLPSPGYLQHITPSSCVGLLLSKGIPRGFGGKRQQAPQASGCRASGGEVLLAGLQTMASSMLLKGGCILSQGLYPDFLSDLRQQFCISFIASLVL